MAGHAASISDNGECLFSFCSTIQHSVFTGAVMFSIHAGVSILALDVVVEQDLGVCPVFVEHRRVQTG